MTHTETIFDNREFTAEMIQAHWANDMEVLGPLDLRGSVFWFAPDGSRFVLMRNDGDGVSYACADARFVDADIPPGDRAGAVTEIAGKSYDHWVIDQIPASPENHSDNISLSNDVESFLCAIGQDGTGESWSDAAKRIEDDEEVSTCDITRESVSEFLEKAEQQWHENGC